MYITAPVTSHKPAPWRIHGHARDFLRAMSLCNLLSLASSTQVPKCNYWPLATRYHLSHAGIVQSCTQRPPVGCLAAFISAHSYNLYFSQAVVTTNKQRVNGRCNDKKWERTMFRDSVAKWKPDRNRLKTHLFFDVPGLQNLQFKITITSENLNRSLQTTGVYMSQSWLIQKLILRYLHFATIKAFLQQCVVFIHLNTVRQYNKYYFFCFLPHLCHSWRPAPVLRE